MKELVEFLAKYLVNRPESVEVKETQGETASILELKVDKEDLGRVIGREVYLYALLVPVYWILISVAAWKGFLQLARGRAHFWEKTQHGLTEAEDSERGQMRVERGGSPVS